MEVKAKIKYLKQSPRKVRLIADLIRGGDVIDAEKQLHFSSKKGAEHLLKLLKSAVSNAENLQLGKDNLRIKEIRVNKGPILKRFMPRARGRATTIRKRTSHVSLTLEEKKK